MILLAAALAATLCIGAEDREAARELMLAGLDDALKQTTARLFDNRLRDRERSPERIVRGMREAIAAYTRSRNEVLKWSPPSCKE